MKLFNSKKYFKNHDHIKNVKPRCARSNLGSQEQTADKKMFKNVNTIVKQNRLLFWSYGSAVDLLCA